ncbi:MAG: ABC transporter ATP-binding protein [Candidatus Binataceae bacterium]
MLVAKNITKRFGQMLALDRVDFEAHRGEIHALVGENGAGKTTLMNIIAGRMRPDDGDASLDGAALPSGSALAALQAGIAAVSQSPMLFERMTWEENLALGGFETDRFDLAAVTARARTLAEHLGFKLPPPGSTIEERSMAERVRLEVLRALSFEPRVLILDEPTGVLAPPELTSFLDLLRRLRGEGRIIVLITHKLGEAIAVADRITVLRQGRVVMRTTPAETSEAELARSMIGELPPPSRAVPVFTGAAPILSIENVSLERDGHRWLDGVSLSLRSGEIAGIAGVDGNGQSELVEILAGARRADSGEIRLLQGTDGAAMAVIPENRDLVGLILDMTLWENVILARPLRERITRGGWLDRSRAVKLCGELLSRFRIRAPGPEAAASALSGGNRQRLEVARAVAAAPKVIVAHNICRGLDLAGTADVHQTLADFAAGGGAVLLISSDLDELLETCGRLFVISRGRVRETHDGERDAEKLGILMAGDWS